MFDLFINTVVEEGKAIYYPTTAGYIALVVLMLACLALAAALSGRKREKLDVKELVFCSVAIALAYITSNFKLYHFPFGGSITLCSMLFICLIGYWYGVKTGLMASIAYGLLQLITDPYVIHPAQLFVDYIFAFGALGMAGLFSNAKHGLLKGYLLGVFGRYVFSVLSGTIFFASYAGDQNPLLYSLGYNIGYLGPEVLLTLVVIAIPALTKAFDTVKRFAVE